MSKNTKLIEELTAVNDCQSALRQIKEHLEAGRLDRTAEKRMDLWSEIRSNSDTAYNNVHRAEPSKKRQGRPRKVPATPEAVQATETETK